MNGLGEGRADSVTNYSLTLRRRDGCATNGFRGGFLGWGGELCEEELADSAFGRVDGWLAVASAGPVQEEDEVVARLCE